MCLLGNLVGRKTSRVPPDGWFKSSGRVLSDLTGGANLVDGQQTWQLAQTHRHDLATMKRCCAAELDTMRLASVPPAPFFFERVAILCRKAGDYRSEIEYCERYIREVEAFYRRHGTRGYADVRKGPRYAAIAKRVPRARQLAGQQVS